jgi:hypothetical protein
MLAEVILVWPSSHHSTEPARKSTVDMSLKTINIPPNMKGSETKGLTLKQGHEIYAHVTHGLEEP